MSGAAAAALIQNERSKLLANALDRASTASLTVGALAPLAAALYSGSGPRPGFLIAGAVVWVAAAATLHGLAFVALGRLRP